MGQVFLGRAVVALAVGLPYANLILYHFYVQGAYFWDVGVFAGTVWHQAAALPTPPLFEGGGLPLFATHIMPLFSALNLLSWCLPFTMPQFFALVIGIGHALPALGVFWLLTTGIGLRAWCAALLAIVMGFSGIALAIIRFPHPEILLAGGGILFAAAWALERPRQAMLWFAFTLSVREDSGFHLCGLLLLLAAVNLWRGQAWRAQRAPLCFAACGFLYAALALVAQRTLFGGAHSPMAAIYLGDPPFHGPSPKLVAERLLGIMLFRSYVTAPALVALIWAYRTRNALIMVGYAAFLPWLALQLMAQSAKAATLSGYYAFPFLIAATWPLAAVVIDARQRGTVPNRRAAIIGFGVMLAASFPGVTGQWDNDAPIDLWRGFTIFPSLARQHATDAAIATLAKAASAPNGKTLGTLTIDESIDSLAPYDFAASDEVDTQAPERHSDTLAYFDNGPESEALRQKLNRGGFPYTYHFPGTSMIVASNRNLEPALGLSTTQR